MCGGGADELNKLSQRKVGQVLHIGLVRKPSLFRDVLAFFQLLAIFVRNRYALVVYSTPKALLLGAVAAFLARQPHRVALIRGRVYENMSGVARWIYCQADKLACGLSNRVLFISRSLLECFVLENIVPEAKAHVLGQGSSNGVDLSKFNRSSASSDRIRCRQELGLSPSDFVLLVAGRLCRDKGIEDVREVVHLLKSRSDIRFVLVGVVEDGSAKALLREFENDSRVLYVEPQDTLGQLMGAADLHLFLTHREGFGNVAIEAAACGLPTLAYNVVGVRDSVCDGVSGKLFEFGDVVGVAEYISAYSVDVEGFYSKYTGASKWAVDHFGQKSVWQHYVDFYRLGLN